MNIFNFAPDYTTVKTFYFIPLLIFSILYICIHAFIFDSTFLQFLNVYHLLHTFIVYSFYIFLRTSIFVSTLL